MPLLYIKRPTIQILFLPRDNALGFRFISLCYGLKFDPLKDVFSIIHNFMWLYDLIYLYVPQSLILEFFDPPPRSWDKIIGTSLLSIYGWIYRLPVWIPRVPCRFVSCLFPKVFGWPYLWCLLFIPNIWYAGYQSTCLRPYWGSCLQTIFVGGVGLAANLMTLFLLVFLSCSTIVSPRTLVKMFSWTVSVSPLECQRRWFFSYPW